MKSVQQVTNFSDIVKTALVIYKTITIGDQEITNVPYVQLDASLLTGGNGPLIKIGYACEAKGIGYPIFITNEGQSSAYEISIGKTGMYEVQPEYFKSLNDITYTEKEILPQLSKIQVPKNIIFKLDYVYEIED